MRLLTGFITYGEITAKYLPYFLPSLKNQDLRNNKIIALDNSEEKNNRNIKYLREYGLDYEQPGGNIGFARAYNKLIRRAAVWQADYFLALNPDMILEPDAIKNMAAALNRDKELAAVSPKVLRWDFKNKKKTKIIDTCGIVLEKGLRFYDAGQGKIDSKKFNAAPIIGPSGAAGMYRMRALEKIKENNQYFDENFFMYKEDCDLAYRLKLAGYKSRCVPGAIIYHDRTVMAKGKGYLQVAINRKNKSKLVKKWSFFGQQYIFLKYWQNQNWRDKLSILFYQAKAFAFTAVFESYLLKEFWRVVKIRNPKSEIRN